jgi:hypothetical protein
MARKIFIATISLPAVGAIRDGYLQAALSSSKADRASVAGGPLPYKGDTLLNFFAGLECSNLLAFCAICEEEGRVAFKRVYGMDEVGRFFTLDHGRNLKDFWELIATLNAASDLIVGHGLLRHDLPLVCRMSAIHRQRPTADLCFGRADTSLVFDTEKEWDPGASGGTPLPSVAKALGLDLTLLDPPLDPPTMYTAFFHGWHVDLVRLCIATVKAAREIYYRFTFEMPPEIPESLSWKGISLPSVDTDF